MWTKTFSVLEGQKKRTLKEKKTGVDAVKRPKTTLSEEVRKKI